MLIFGAFVNSSYYIAYLGTMSHHDMLRILKKEIKTVSYKVPVELQAK